MPHTFEFGRENRWHDQYFARALAVTADGVEGENALAVGQHHGALAVSVAAAGGAVTATGLAVSIMESDTAEGPFEARADGPVITVSGDFEDGVTLALMGLPDCKRYVKIHLEGTLTGTVDVFMSYLAR